MEPDGFGDGLGDDLIGDEEDRKRLGEMTEKEREQVLFERIERREALKTRCACCLYFGINLKFLT